MTAAGGGRIDVERTGTGGACANGGGCAENRPGDNNFFN